MALAAVACSPVLSTVRADVPMPTLSSHEWRARYRPTHTLSTFRHSHCCDHPTHITALIPPLSHIQGALLPSHTFEPRRSVFAPRPVRYQTRHRPLPHNGDTSCLVSGPISGCRHVGFGRFHCGAPWLPRVLEAGAVPAAAEVDPVLMAHGDASTHKLASMLSSGRNAIAAVTGR